MTSERLREAHQARPFQPFFMHLADGRRLEVRHPELLAIAPSGRTAVVIAPDDSTHIVDLLLVTDLQFKSNRRRDTRRRAG